MKGNDANMVASRPALSVLPSAREKNEVSRPLSKAPNEIAPEISFMDTVLREVRRTERSGRPFVLALVSDTSCAGGEKMRHSQEIAAAIAAATRETDCLGWYEQNTVLGVLLTEIGEADQTKLALLSQKIVSALEQSVSQEQFRALRVVVRLFPQHSSEDGGGGWEGDIYRDVHRQLDSDSPEKFMKRAIDIAASLLALLVFSPILVVIAVLIKLTSRGPVLYCQKRVGQYGRLFDFYKFRSMFVNNDPKIHQDYVAKLIEGVQHVRQSNGLYKLVNDPRVTQVGRVLRHTSLDELPQFFNVLRGDMSLVGPRPPVPYEFERYRTWHRRRVLEIKPGLTGLWQVKGRSRTTFDEMVRMDLHYARTRSLWLDLKIILQTPAAMFRGTGAA